MGGISGLHSSTGRTETDSYYVYDFPVHESDKMSGSSEMATFKDYGLFHNCFIPEVLGPKNMQK